MKSLKILMSFIVLSFLLASSVFSSSVSGKYSSIEIEQALKRLTTLGSVLYIGAHPDDENTALLAWLSKEKLVRTGYLSLTRGGGGQNLIGSEKGSVLSAVRTNELLAARRVDGAEQYFSRAVDFGYSKTTKESLKIWNKRQVLSDIVFIMRKFKPDVIITRFTQERGGHGHHTASALLAVEAFNLSGDPEAFSDQLKTLSPWSPKRILWNSWLPRIKGADPKLKEQLISVNLGTFNPLLGKSYMEIAAISRSMHKSQGFGAVPYRGERIDYFQHLAGNKASSGIFDGIDLSWKRIKMGSVIGEMTKKVHRQFNRYKPYESIPLLLEIYKNLNQKPSSYWIDKKKQEVHDLIGLCSGLWIEALSSSLEVVNKQSIDISVEILNRSPLNILIEKIELPLKNKEIKINQELKTNIINKTKVNYLVENGYPHPYWLKAANKKGQFNHKQNLLGIHGIPFPYNIKVHLNISGTKLTFIRPILFKWRDPVKGEQREKLTVTPPATVHFPEKIFYFTKNKGKKFNIVLKGHSESITGQLILNAPLGWRITPNKIKFNLKNISEEKHISINISPPQEEKSGILEAELLIDGKKYKYSRITIKYDHLPKIDLFPVAKIKLIKTNLKKKINNIGYITGPGDEIPKYLEQIGYKVSLLKDREISNGDLNKYETIITGIRAYNTRKVLSSANSRLMEYVKSGGNLVVQYNVSRGLVVKNIGPYPFSISRRRVTEENALIKMSSQSKGLFQYPNIIKKEHFDNWIQERGLYFADNWSKGYLTPIESHDTGEARNYGGLLYCNYGKGSFIYTGYAFFRQIPDGNVGAFKLFINLIESVKRDTSHIESAKKNG